MEHLLLLVFTLVETFCLHLFIFILFRFTLKDMLPHLVFVSVLYANASYYVRGHFQLDTLVANMILLVFSWMLIMFLYHIKAFQAVLLAFICNALLMIVEYSVIYVCHFVYPLPLDTLYDDYFSLRVRALQGIFICVMLLLSWLTYRFRIGFTFIETTEYEEERITPRMVFQVVLGLTALILSSLSLRYAVISIHYLIGTIVILILIFFLLVIWLLKMEEQSYR
ncbi:hypothetical protein [Marinicrinis sediminis]|uniref:Uncharacterized protein n=1 Tax=Marinicrinis sediminis TaxID=1652465 RepID=A0ABW5RAH1_9BACL